MIKKLMTTLAAFTLVVGLSACATTDSNGTTTGKVKPYPKDVCVVTGNELGSMGDPVTLVHEGQEMKFCCKPCVRKFKADPQKYLSRL